MDCPINDFVYVKCTRDASGALMPVPGSPDLNLFNFPSGAGYSWDPTASRASNALDWDGQYSNGEFDFDLGMEVTPLIDEEMNCSAQQATLVPQPSLPPATPPKEESPLFQATINYLDSPGVTPPLSPSSLSGSIVDGSAFIIRPRSSTTSQFPPALPQSSPAHNVIPIITSNSLPPHISSSTMFQTPTTQFSSPTEENFEALLASLCQFMPPSAECANLTTAFRQPEQFHLRALLDSILTSPWLATHGVEPKDEKNRSILLGFLAHESTGGTYRCLFEGCNKSLDRQDRALGHIRMHVGHRPHACGGICGVPECQERFYCQSYLRSHARRQKAPCDICQQSFFRRDLRKHRLSCQGIQNQAHCIPNYSIAFTHARSVNPMGNVAYGQSA